MRLKVLFDHSQPFVLGHGGFQIVIEQTLAALVRIGVQVEPIRWWDDSQSADIIHYFGRPHESYLQLARSKNIKVVVADLFSELGSRPALVRLAQKAAMATTEKVLPRSFTYRLAWRSFREADACIALTEWEAHLLRTMFGAPAERLHVVPNGVEEPFLEAPAADRGPWLVCTATITERKRVLELAQAAVQAKTPVWIIGKPYGEAEAYAQRFAETAKQNPTFVRYEGPVNDRRALARIYREARGFVLLSSMESLSLSALEAAACECPLLLSDLPWARTVFEESASYCPANGDMTATAQVLKKFYDAAPTLKAPPRPLSWEQVALQFKAIYERLLTDR